MTRKQYAAHYNKTLAQLLSESVPTGATLAAFLYSDLHSEYSESDSRLLFDNWLAQEKPALLAFFRSIDGKTRQALMIIACHE